MNERAQQREYLVGAALEAARRQPAFTRVGPPQVGDVFLFPEPPDLDFRWVIAVVEDGEYYVVPADTHFLVGATDFVVADSTRGSPLVVRCDFGCWLEEACFQRGRYLATINAEDIHHYQNVAREFF